MFEIAFGWIGYRLFLLFFCIFGMQLVLVLTTRVALAKLGFRYLLSAINHT